MTLLGYAMGMIGAVVVIGLLIWVGITLVLNTWRRLWRRRPAAVAEPPLPDQSISIADEAQEWLESQ